MKKFTIGDRVVVESEDFKTQNGLIGTVEQLHSSPSLPILVVYDPGQDHHAYLAQYPSDCRPTCNAYGLQDLKLVVSMEDTRHYLELLNECKGG